MEQPPLPGFEPEGELVFCRSFWHAKAQRRIYAPPGRVFAFRLKTKRHR